MNRSVLFPATARVAFAVMAVPWLLLAAPPASGDPKQRFSIKATDENGDPVERVQCKAWFKQPGMGVAVSDYVITGETNASGHVNLSGETVWARSSVEGRLDGYYGATQGSHWTIKRNGNRWEPWPVEVHLVMKKVRDPKPMFVVKFDNQQWLSFPNKELGPFGFDLMVGDWVHPYGTGRIADFVMEAQRDDPDVSAVMPKGKVLLTFSNPNDGILSLHDPGGSELVGPFEVPDNAKFKDHWTFDNFKVLPDHAAQRSNDFSDEVYVFRIRTQVNDEGEVESAHYGKIDGRIVGWLPQASPGILMTYYLNGTINGRGLEWDRKNNLMRDNRGTRIPERS